MFTGIIEELGSIQNIHKGEKEIEMTIGADEILKDVQLGDSISVNGVCLTVTQFREESFQVDVMPETVKATSLRTLDVGSKVNLERAMAAGGRFGGHFVSGHVDGIGKIVQKKPEANAVYYQIEIPKELQQFFMLKGSVAVDGTSLTVFGVDQNIITISLIPHTVSHTVLGDKEKGDIVNIECDMLAKYVANMLFQKDQNEDSQLNEGFLKENGFI
ncbi:riboflavin synthase [Salinibacillus xinjiangensis]|uniref:Riboflavin synthase n=1 Tax=Salinibacillus xinjiangensis TaxID=1229268 RepID=A0A6G1X8N8_9BACI|nr:riboflavin synthase [Salinibacillus xinjiangensis]MRG87307.1 riboflavin synthase [Salinibacillus xinjiangensis]